MDGGMRVWGFAQGFRLAVPADWRREEEADGLTAFQGSARDLSVFRVSVRAVPCGATETPAVALQRAAWLFLRPDDPRLSDRDLETAADGGLLGRAVGCYAESGEIWRHYLWLRGCCAGGAARLALLDYAFPAGCDGRDPWRSLVAALDAAIIAADFADVANPADAAGMPA